MLYRNLKTLSEVIFSAAHAKGELAEKPAVKIRFKPMWSLSETEQATGEEVLCGKRTDNKLICGAGGHIQEGETPAQAAIRETQEEFGITPLNLKRLGKITDFESGKYGEPIIYLCTEYEGEPKRSEEIRNPCFFPIDEFEPEKIAVFPPFAESLKFLAKG